MCGAFAAALLDLIASSTRTKSPAELVTTAERMAPAPLGTPTRDGVPPYSEGMSHTVWERSSPTIALMETGLRAIDAGTKALAANGDHTTVASVATEVSNLIFQRRRA